MRTFGDEQVLRHGRVETRIRARSGILGRYGASECRPETDRRSLSSSQQKAPDGGEELSGFDPCVMP